EISFTTAAANVPTPPACATITSPGNGATDIALDATITWTAVSDADGYYVTIGTTSGGNELLDGASVTGTSYSHASDFAENTTYYISVGPYNSVGEATGCAEISFTTETLATVPDCTTITFPGNGATDIALDAAITWTAVSDADGYYITIGTSSGGNELVDAVSVTGTSYTHNSDFAENTTYFVSVVSFNSVGEAEGCAEISFTTETLATVPDCTTITSPGNGATDVALDAAITWTAVSDADGYYVTIGTTSGGNELVDALSVTGTSYTHTSDFAENTTYFVSVVPYNAVGEAAGCTEISYTTETLPTPPDCTLISFPNNQNNGIPVMSIISWQEVENAEGYYVTLTQTSSGEAVLSNQIVFEMSIDLSGKLEYGQEYEISVIPFNGQGEAETCGSSLFTTESLDFNPKTKYGISPNGDGVNDFWEIEGIESFPDNKVAVYNRWGDKVFEVESYDNQLNVFEGRASRLQYLGAGELPEGTYFFEIQILSEEAKGKYRGFLIIKR
ncbi:gliding motility-associated C-terminal domain-containing protein, partial [Algoriphagus zhangzhouensis]